jgi:PAS domain S-box-containing protein
MFHGCSWKDKGKKEHSSFIPKHTESKIDELASLITNNVMCDQKKSSEELLEEVKSLRQEVARLRSRVDLSGKQMSASTEHQTGPPADPCEHDIISPADASVHSQHDSLDDGEGQERREDETRFSAVFENAPIGMVVSDLHGKALVANRVLRAMFHVEDGELVGLTPSEVTVAEDWQQSGRLFAELAEGRRSSYRIEKRYRRIDGTFFWGDATGVLIRNAAGEPSHTVGMIRDTTEEKRVLDALRTSEDKFHRAFRTIPLPCAISTLNDGRILEANDAFLALAGLPDDEVRGRSVLELGLYTSGADRDKIIAALEQSGGGPCRLELNIGSKSGTQRQIEFSATVLESNGEPCFLGIGLDVTERRQREAALQESRERLQLALDGGELGLWDEDLRTGKLVVNDHWASMLGYAFNEIGPPEIASFERLVHPDDLPAVNAAFDAHLRGERRIFEAELRMRCKSGRWKWILSRGKVMAYDESGGPLRATGTHTDIDDRKRVSQILERRAEELETAVAQRTKSLVVTKNRLEAEITRRQRIESDLDFKRKFLQAIIDKSGNGICVWHAKTDFPFIEFSVWNDHMTEISGFSLEEINRIGWWRAMYPDLTRAENVLHQMLALWETDDGINDDWIMVRDCWELTRKDMSKRFVSITARFIENEHGQRHVLNAIVDITERVRAECELRAKDAAIASSINGIVIVNPHGTITYANAAFLQMWGYDSTEHVIGRRVVEFWADTNAALRAYKDTCENGGWAGEMAGIRANGEHFEVQVSSSPVVDRDGNLDLLMASFVDITPRKEAERRMRELEQIRKESERLITAGRLATRLAHEINNPLAGIMSSFRLVKQGIPKNHRHYRFVPMIDREINRIGSIVRQTLDLGRTVRREATLTDIATTMEEVVTILEPHSRQHEVSVRTETVVPAESWLDDDALRQVLYNLISNAIEASRPGQVVVVSAGLASRELCLTIQDEGCGIPVGTRNRIFEPYFTTKESGVSGGLGLGLSITKQIVDSLDGIIEYKSLPEKGTTFVVRIPLVGREG